MNFFYFRPYVLAVKWLLDSFSKGVLQPEETYFHASYKPAEIQAPAQPVLNSSIRTTSGKAPLKTDKRARSRQADEDLLSQYTDNDSTLSKIFWDYLLLYIFLAKKMFTW